jgi:uncharacterized lipoprotein YddW (UPF0748 family)
MNKREFLKTMGAGVLGVAASGLPGAGEALAREAGEPAAREPRAGAPERAMNWVWITPDTETPDDEWKRRFAHMRAHGIHAIIPEIWEGRRAHYRSSYLPQGSRWLEQILPLAKAEGLEVHGWMVTMPFNNAELGPKHPEWFMVNGKGESALTSPAYVDYYRFMCPNQPGVQEHLKRQVEEISSIEELDGVHFDYIRFPDVILAKALQPKYGLVQDREYPEYDYCYCDVCRREFEAKYGFDPRSLPDPAASPEWREFRYDSVTKLMNEHLIPIIRRHGKKVSASTFPNWEHVRQRWHRWELDYALPMLYHNYYYGDANWVRDETRAGIDRIREAKTGTQLFSGLFMPDLYPNGLRKLIEGARAGGAKGVVLFSYRHMNDRLWPVVKGAFA